MPGFSAYSTTPAPAAAPAPDPNAARKQALADAIAAQQSSNNTNSGAQDTTSGSLQAPNTFTPSQQQIVNSGDQSKQYGDQAGPGANWFGSKDQAEGNYVANVNRDKWQTSLKPYETTIDPTATNTAVAQYGDLKNQAQDSYTNAGKRNGATMSAVSMGNTQLAGSDRPFEQGQESLVSALQNQANGKGPSVAGLQLQQANEANQKNALALAASQRGHGNAALSQRSIADQAAQGGQQTAMQSAQTRMQEQLSAQGQLGNALTQARGQSLQADTSNASLTQDTNKTNAGFAQQANANNQDAEMQQRGLNDNLQTNMMSNMMTDTGGTLSAEQTLQNMNNQNYWNAANMKNNKDISDTQAVVSGITGGATAVVGAASKISDKRAKKDITTASDKKVRSLVEALSASEYRYKDKQNGDQKYIGPMAQELEKSELGKGLVINTPKGKMVDTGRAAMLALSSEAQLNKRLDGFEEQLKKALKAKGKR